MKAAILFESKKPLVVDNVEMPNKLSYGQVLVKVCYSGICGSQINEIDAVKEKDKYLPHLLGHEGSGFVEEIGEGVSRLKPGDHVIMHWKKGAGIDSATPKYVWKKKLLNAGYVTTFNEKAIVSENRLTKIPKDFDLKVAALFGCAVLTGFGVVNNDANIKIGQSVLIFGVGGVGLNISQASSLVSAYPVVGVDLNHKKLKLGKNFGLTHIVNSNDINFLEKIILINKGKKFDNVIDTTGSKKVIEQSYNLTCDDGKTILVGVPKEKITIYSLPLHFKKILKGSHGGSARPSEDIPNYINLFINKKIDISKLITHQFKIDQINEAIKLFRSGNCGRIIISMKN